MLLLDLVIQEQQYMGEINYDDLNEDDFDIQVEKIEIELDTVSNVKKFID